MENKKILITGSNGGIGLYVTEYFLEQGKKNLLCHVRSASEEIDSLLRKHDLDPARHVLKGDLTDEVSVRGIGKKVKEQGDDVEVLINVAGSATNGVSWKLSLADFNNVIGNNLVSTFLMCREFVPGMRERGCGRIINFSSVVASTGIAGAAHYAAAKAGIISFSKSMALELAPKKVAVNTIALGYFDTGLIEHVSENLQNEIKARIPSGRFGNQKDVGSTAYFLAQQATEFLTGQVIQLNGGQF